MQQEYKQARNTLELIIKYIERKKGKLNILDFGGASGHFLLPMKKKGHNCFLVDYDKHPLSGITRLGNTLNDIPSHYKFDLILCRHVLEHVASPKKIIVDFREYLSEKGVVYSEVPIELWKATLPNIDPVTHINYFHEKSIQILFQVSGYDVVMSREKRTTYRGHSMMVAQTIAISRPVSKKINFNNSFKKTKRLLYPNNLNVFLHYKHRPIYMMKLIFERIFKPNN